MAEDSSSSEETEVSASVVANSRVPLGSCDSLLPGLSDDVAMNCLARVPISDCPSLSCVNKKYNKLINGGELFSLRKELGIVEYLVFMLCEDWLVFSPMKKKWMSLPKIPVPGDNLHYANNESFSVGGELLAFGRGLFEFVIWKYSLRSRSWVKCEGMHQPRWLFASGSLGGIAIVAGGTGVYRDILASAELYNSSSGKWEMLPNMHSPRSGCSAFFMDGKFYVLGGMSSRNTSLNCGEEFDLETRKWRKIEGMYPHVNHATLYSPLFVVVNNELFAREYPTYMVKKYDKMKNIWEVMGRLPPMESPANDWAVACGDQVLSFCSQDGVHGKEIVVKSWSPKSETKDGNLEWKVLGVKENIGDLVYNCAVIGV